MTEEEGIQWVRGMIRAEMVKRRFTYLQLVDRLRELGIDENERNLRNKVARGTFSAVFFVSCLEAMGVDTLALDMHHAPEGERSSGSSLPATTPREKRLAANADFVAKVREMMRAGNTAGQLNHGPSEHAVQAAQAKATGQAATVEPTMEEILASIRAIIAEDGAQDQS